MQITLHSIDASLSSSLESISQNTDPLGQDNLVNVTTDAASSNMTKEASNSDLTENSNSSEVEDNNMEEVTFTTVTSKKRKKKNKQKTGNLTLEKTG
ncbi:9935_t:CDS:1, partial [Cetraspora pellucida]